MVQTDCSEVKHREQLRNSYQQGHNSFTMRWKSRMERGVQYCETAQNMKCASETAFILHGLCDPRFFLLMWHRSDMTHECVSWSKAHGFWYSQIGFTPHSYVKINMIWIRCVHLHLPCKWADWIFPIQWVVQHWKSNGDEWHQLSKRLHDSFQWLNKSWRLNPVDSCNFYIL